MNNMIVLNLIVICIVCFSTFIFGNDVIQTNTEEVSNDPKRKPSMFKIGEDWLALPEVFSNLDFSADSAPAKEDDLDGQLRLRSTRFWGRLYIDGWPQTIQFFRAHFGTEPPIGKIYKYNTPNT